MKLTLSGELPLTALHIVLQATPYACETRVPPDSSKMSVSPYHYSLSVYTTNDSCTSYTGRVTILCGIEPEDGEGQSSHVLCTHTYASKYT